MAAVTRIPIPAWQKVQNHDDRLDLPVSELDLPVRVINFLEDDGIFTVGQLLHCTTKNVGLTTVKTIIFTLGKIGLPPRWRSATPLSPRPVSAAMPAFCW